MYRIATTTLNANRALLAITVSALIAVWLLLLPTAPVNGTTRGVVVWWGVLCALSVINLSIWCVSATALERSRPSADPDAFRYQRWLLVLAAIYVVGCGFRSILPRADVQRIGLHDSWLSSVVVGRSVATVAELCFVAQWALLLHWIATANRCRFSTIVAKLLVPMIVVAEISSWYAVLTTCYLGNAIEESIWASAALLLLICGWLHWPRCAPACRPFLAAVLLLGLGYVAFMVTVDVPMYVSRWLTDEANCRVYLTLAQGWHDVSNRWHVTFDWEAWRTEMPWMTLYFSVAVWSSIGLVHAPWFKTQRPENDSAA